MTYDEIAAELNATGKVPENDEVRRYSVARFINDISPGASKHIVQTRRERMMETVNLNFDIIYELKELFVRSKYLLERLEEEAESKDKVVNPYQYKAIASEVREILKQMTEIQREVNDYDNIKKFIEIVLETVNEEAPETMPLIIGRLKNIKNSVWFSEIQNRVGI